jgi:hypothetical protein
MISKKRRKFERRGRPRKANARYRATTLAERAPPPDPGTPQLRRLKLRATTRTDVEINGSGVLFGRGHLDAAQYDVLSTVTMWLSRLARGWGGTGGVGGLWAVIIGAAVPTGFVRPQNVIAAGIADGARRQLERALTRLDGSRDLVVSLAEGHTPPIVLHAIQDRFTGADEIELDKLRSALDALGGGRRTRPGRNSS